MFHDVHIHQGDAAKYMSYIKISKKQLKLVKDIKHSGPGDGIQSKYLSCILGDIRTFTIHPYGALEEEEKNSLHRQWLQLATKELPPYFEKREENKLEREQWLRSLEKEIIERARPMDKDDEMNYLEHSSQETRNGYSENINERDHEAQPAPDSTHIQHAKWIPSHNSHQELSPMTIDKEAMGQVVLKPSNSSAHILQFSRKMDVEEDAVEPIACILSAKDMLHTGNIQDWNYQTSESCGCEEPSVHVIDLERDILEPEAGEAVRSTLHMENGVTPFCSNSNHDFNELLSHFPEGLETLSSYVHEHTSNSRQLEFQFLMAKGNLSGSEEFNHQFQEKNQLLEQRQVREREVHMNQMKSTDMYSSSRCPNQGYLLSAELHDMDTLKSSTNCGLLGYNYFPDEHQVEFASSRGQCFGNGGNAGGSLLSPLSHCKNQLSGLPYDTRSQQFIEPGTYYASGVSNNSNMHVYNHHQQLKNAASLDAAATPLSSALWMNFLQPNSSRRDPTGRDFLRSWNR